MQKPPIYRLRESPVDKPVQERFSNTMPDSAACVVNEAVLCRTGDANAAPALQANALIRFAEYRGAQQIHVEVRSNWIFVGDDGACVDLRNFVSGGDGTVAGDRFATLPYLFAPRRLILVSGRSCIDLDPSFWAGAPARVKLLDYYHDTAVLFRADEADLAFWRVLRLNQGQAQPSVAEFNRPVSIG